MQLADTDDIVRNEDGSIKQDADGSFYIKRKPFKLEFFTYETLVRGASHEAVGTADEADVDRGNPAAELRGQ